jgi:WD40 repeat protein
MICLEQDGLLAIIDLKDKKKPYHPVDIRFNIQGDAFLVADTRG